MSNSKKKSSIIVNTLVLLIVSVIAVALLATVNQFTRGPIAQAEIDARAAAYKVVYPSAENFAEIEDTEKLIEQSADVLAKAGLEGCKINDVLAVTDKAGKTVGYVISSTSPSGYGGDVQVAIGISAGKLTGFDVIDHKETPGFGAKCEEDTFKSQFAGKAAKTLAFTKSGAKSDTEFDAVSGATITSNAIQDALNAAITFYQANFGGGVEAVEEVDPMEKAYEGVNLDALTDVDVVETSNDDYTVDAVSKTEDGGYIISVTAHNGYDGDLQIAIGIDANSIIKGYGVLMCNETKGLGSQCTKDEYGAQFVGLKAETVSFVKGGGANKDNNEIDAIASATITTNATITAVNGAIEYYNNNLKGE